MFLTCPIAQFLWCVVRDSFQWPSIPQDVYEFVYLFLAVGVTKINALQLIFFAFSAWSSRAYFAPLL